MDKTWMSKSRVSSEYQQGVKEFLDFAFANISSDHIVCPCRRCVNSVLLTRDEIYEHLIINGIMRSYNIWYDHGESSSSSKPKDLHGPQPTHRELLEENQSLKADREDMRKQLNMVVSILGQLTGVEGDLYDIMAHLSNKGPGNYRAHLITDIGSSLSFENGSQQD